MEIFNKKNLKIHQTDEKIIINFSPENDEGKICLVFLCVKKTNNETSSDAEKRNTVLRRYTTYYP